MRILLLNIFSFAVLANVLFASDYNVHRTWTMNDGLKSAAISSIISDEKGFIWISTSKGLAKFDGNKFYYFDQFQSDKIITDDFTSAISFNDGIIAGTKSFGIYWFNSLQTKHLKLSADSKSNIVKALSVFDSSRILAATVNGLYVYDINQYRTIDSIFTGLRINDVVLDSEGLIYASVYSKGIYKINRSLQKVDSLTTPEAKNILDLEYFEEEVWGASSLGLYEFKFGVKPNKFISRSINQLHLGREQLFVCTTNGLYKLKNGSVVKVSFPEQEKNPEVSVVFEDEEKRLWFGSNNQLHLIENTTVEVFDKSDNLESEDVTAIYETTQKNILLGTNGGGLYRYENGSKDIRRVPSNLSSIWSIYEDEQGRIYLAGTGMIAVHENNREKIYKYDRSPQSNITVIRKSRQDNAILLTNTFGEILRFDGKQIFNPIMGRMIYTEIYSICKVSDTMWVATDLGLYKQYERKLKLFNADDGFKSSSFRTIYCEKFGPLWFGTNGGGLIKYINSTFTNYSFKDGFPFQDVFAIEKAGNNFWYYGSEGLCTVPVNDFEMYDNNEIDDITSFLFGTESGLPVLECNTGYNNSLHDSDGNLWFATNTGAVKFHPDSLLSKSNNIVIEINHLKIDGEPAADLDNVQLDIEKNNIELDFSVLYFGNESNLNFSYRLNESNQWVELNGQKRILLNNLQPGEYDLEIQVVIRNKKSHSASMVIPIEVIPKFYQTLPFKILSALLISLFVLGFVKQRLKAYKEKNIQLTEEISRRKKIENQLRQNEILVKSLLNNTYQFQGLLELNGNIKIANNASLKFIGKSINEIVGKPFWETSWWEQTSEMQEKLKQWIHKAARGHVIRERVKHKSKNGSAEDFDFIMKPVYDNNRRPTFIIVEGHIITDILEAEQALKRSESKYRNFVEKASDGIIIISKGKINYVNQTLAKLLGYKQDEMVGENFQKFVHPSEREKVYSNYKKRISGEKVPPIYESKLYHKTEVPVYVEINSSVVDFGETDETVLAFIRDLSDRIKAKEDLKKAYDYVQTILNAISTAIISIDLELNVAHFNKAAEIFSTNLNRSNLLFEKFEKLGFIKNVLYESMQQNKEKSSLFEISNGDDNKKYSVTVFPLENENRPGNVLLIEDVTQEKKIEELMIHSEKMISIAGLAAGMAHEINNPLGTIVQGCQNIIRRTSDVLPKNSEIAEKLGMSIEVLEKYMKERQIDEIIKSMRSAAGKASAIINNMLQFSRRSESKKVVCDVVKLVDDALELAYNDYDMKKKFDFRSIQVKKEISEPIPKIKLTVTEIEQVIFNILRNAAQALHHEIGKTSVPQIIFRLYQENKFVVIEIEDNGPGISEENKSRIFEPFFTTKNIGEGTGLGLSVSYMIVHNNHGGQLTFKSEKGKGTTFIIKLPK